MPAPSSSLRFFRFILLSSTTPIYLTLTLALDVDASVWTGGPMVVFRLAPQVISLEARLVLQVYYCSATASSIITFACILSFPLRVACAPAVGWEQPRKVILTFPQYQMSSKAY